MNALAKKLIQVAGLLLALGYFSTPAFCQKLASASIGTSLGSSVGQNLGTSIGSALGQTTIKGTSSSTGSSQASLPPCNLDSFVHQAGANAEQIYGDEGTTGLPPLFGFTVASRINAGITGQRDAGLTTGHGSYMPNAWGADEFLAPPGEWSLSGTNGGNTHYNNAAAALDAADQAEANTSSSGSNNSSTCTSGPGGVSPNPNFPNAPGPGYYSIVGCGGDFQGWMDPNLVQIGYTNWGLALYDFYTSSEFIGDPLEAQYEISQIEASGALGGS